MARDTRMLAFGAGLMEGINRGRKNLQELKQKRAKLDMDKEKHDMEMKISKVQLDYHKRVFGDDDPTYLINKHQFDTINKAATYNYNLGTSTLSQASRGEQTQVGAMEQKLQTVSEQYVRDNYGAPPGMYMSEKTESSPITDETRTYKSREELEAKSNKNIASPEGLNSEQQLQARALARKIAGVNGAERILPSIFAEMKSGKTIDQVEDALRFSGQSESFRGPIRNAVQSMMITDSDNKAQATMDRVDDMWSQGDKVGAKETLKRIAREKAGVEESRGIVAKERTVGLLNEIRGDLKTLEAKGFNTNIFAGTAEEVAKKIGAIYNPEFRQLATKIQTAIVSYRKGVTGVAFNELEAAEYKAMFPSIGRTAAFNTATINALTDVFGGDLENFYSLSMGPSAYKELFGDKPTDLQYREGDTATNKATGVQLIYRGGQWQPK